MLLDSSHLRFHRRAGAPMPEAQIPAKVSTHIEGLDNILMGGFLRHGFYLIQGDPGSGKTTLALQFVLGRVRAGERFSYITLTESRRDLELTCRAHGWSLAGLEVRD